MFCQNRVKSCHRAAFLILIVSGFFNVLINAQPYQWNLPPGFPQPIVPDDNPISEVKVELGRRLFFDTRLSVDNTYSCASCHKPELAFTDGLARAKGVHGDLHPRSTMTLTNVAYNPVFGWASRETDSLEQQALIPMFNQEPKELGLQLPVDEVIQRFKNEEEYSALFNKTFPENTPSITLETITKAIAAFERTLIFGNSAYDRYVFLDDQHALTEDQKAGMRLFFSDRLGCSHCHSGFNFSSPSVFVGSNEPEIEFHNTNLYNQYTGIERGLFNESKNAEDSGLFRAPTLRNIELTGPYMHDGSVETLKEVVLHYANGGRINENFPQQKKPNKLISPAGSLARFEISETELNQLVLFLKSLTDPLNKTF